MSGFKHKILKLMLAAFMVFSQIPTEFVYALETENHEDHNHETEVLEQEETSNETTEVTVEDVQAEIDRILVTYLGSTNLSEEEVTDIVIEMNWLDMIQAESDIVDLEKMASQLSDDDLNKLNTSSVETLSYFDSMIELTMTPGLYTTVTVLDGKISITDSANKVTEVVAT